MIKAYLKQAWAMMKQNRLFTSIYVVGTALSVAFTMILFIVYYVKFGPVYPEYNRNRTLVINNLRMEGKDNGTNYMCNAGVGVQVIDMLKDLPHLDKIAGSIMVGTLWNDIGILLKNNEEYKPMTNLVNSEFWDVFSFQFVSGKPFSEVDVASNLPKVIISESLAQRIFAQTDVAGQSIQLEGKDYEVCGVVKDASTATKASMGELYLPLFFIEELTSSNYNDGLTGNITLYITAPTEGDVEALRSEILEVFKNYNLQDAEWNHNLMGQPDIYWKSFFRNPCENEPDIAAEVRSILYMLLALLFIPAMNLCGMISSRMDERLSELGVRKAYGATNRSLIHQVLTENLLLTIIGGLIGLTLAYALTLAGGKQVLSIFDSDMFYDMQSSMSIHLDMLINLPLFATVLGVCILLNLISALVPTILALRHPIINSIHSKR